MIEIPFKEFNDSVNKIKSMKSDIILIFNNGLVYGADSSISIIKTTSLPIILTNSYFLTTTASIVEFVKYTSEMGCQSIRIDEFGNIFSDFGSLYRNYDGNLYQKFTSIIDRINLLTVQSPKVFSNDNIKESYNDFNDILSLKTADGNRAFNINNQYVITLNNNILPVNKSDKVALEIFDIDTISYLYGFSILKSKNIIKVYIRCLKV